MIIWLNGWLVKFWLSRAAGKGVCGGAKIFGSALLQPALSVCVSLSAFFIIIIIIISIGPMTVVGGLCRMVLGAPRCPHAAEVARASCSCPPEVTSSFSCCRPKCCADWHRFLSNMKVQAYMCRCLRSACISAAVADKPLDAFLQKQWRG